MKRDDLAELHFITPIVNVPSILKLGILSHRRAELVPHESIAKEEVQTVRSTIEVPSGRPLHEYANLYLCARNPMLYKRHNLHVTLCILRVSTDVLDLPNVVVTDQNARSGYARFGSVPDALALIDHDIVFAEFWTYPDDPIAYWQHKSAKCAEVLVPDTVPPTYILGAYVSCASSQQALLKIAPKLPVTIDGHLFFL